MIPQYLIDVFDNPDIGISITWIAKRRFGYFEDIGNSMEEISINVDLLVAQTFIHEALHSVFNDLSEEEVEDKSWRIIENMTVAEIRHIAGRVFDAKNHRKK